MMLRITSHSYIFTQMYEKEHISKGGGEMRKPQAYTAEQLATVMSVSPQTIRNWGRDGKIGVIQPFGKGGAIRYYIKALIH